MTASAGRLDGKQTLARANTPRKSVAGGTVVPLRRVKARPGVGSLIGDFLLRNPLAVGSGTAFLVALSFVSANAMWGQTQSHHGAFFPTRALPAGWKTEATTTETTTTGAIAPAAARLPADPTLRRVQAELGRMGFYDGSLDGLAGPATRKAIAAFQARNGLKATGELDGALLASLEKQIEAADARIEAGIGADDRTASLPATESANGANRRIARVQAGLKAFGIDGIEVDGVMGARTHAGIREFQKMFGLPETGEPDDALLAKMHETGLAD